MASYIKKIKLDTTTYEIRDSSAVHSGDTNVNISITGSAESANTANSATTAETADVATKLGTTVVGGSNQPIYLNNGVPTAIGYTIADNVPSGAKFTDTVYTHPTYESRANGLYKITVDGIGHVSEAVAVTKDDIATLTFRPTGNSYLTFSSPNSFTIAVGDATKHWNGTLEYFSSDKVWTTWDGTTTLSSVDNDGEHVLYLRGTGNTVITGNSSNYKWVLTGSDVVCSGNIENLLDYVTVESGAHPTMANYCYAYMFSDCSGLTQAPSLPVTTLANYCYSNMFYGCDSLIQAPTLPATTLAEGCYSSMFSRCSGLTQAPALPAIKLAKLCYSSMFSDCSGLTQAPALPTPMLAERCYSSMFYGCSGLTQAPALPATTLEWNCYSSMFYSCTSLKLSSTQTDEYTQEYRIPSSGTGTTASYALDNMFTSTGGTFTGTPEINTTYYLSTDNMIVRETEIATLNGYVGSMIDAITTSKVSVADIVDDLTTNVANKPLSAAQGVALKALIDALTKTIYQKPTGGIPKTDLASGVQASLEKADTAVQTDDLDDYALKSELPINVKDYGAVCDGVTDDTTSVQNALNAAQGKTLIIDGVCKITSPLTVKDNTKIIGIGSRASGFDSYVAGTLFTSANDKGIYQCLFRNLRIRNRNLSPTDTDGQYIGQVFNSLYESRVTECYIEHFAQICNRMARISSIDHCGMYYVNKSLVNDVIDSMIDSNYINARNTAADRTIMVYGVFSNSMFANNFCDYWGTVFRLESGSKPSNVICNTFDNCVSVFRDYVVGLSIVGNNYTNIKYVPTNWQSGGQPSETIQSTKWSVFKFDGTTVSHTGSSAQCCLLDTTFNSNTFRNCSYYIDVENGVPVYPVQRCKFSDNAWEGLLVDAAFTNPQSAYDNGGMRTVYFDFWEGQSVDVLPSANLVSNAAKSVATYDGMTLWYKNREIRNFNGAWRFADGSVLPNEIWDLADRTYLSRTVKANTQRTYSTEHWYKVGFNGSEYTDDGYAFNPIVSNITKNGFTIQTKNTLTGLGFYLPYGEFTFSATLPTGIEAYLLVVTASGTVESRNQVASGATLNCNSTSKDYVLLFCSRTTIGTYSVSNISIRDNSYAEVSTAPYYLKEESQTKSIADIAGYYTSDTVEGALAEVGKRLSSLSEEIANLPQPDWNQNDNTQPDYVKNRPFYESISLTTLLEEQQIDFSSSFDIQNNIVVGETYIVHWDDAEYTIEATNKDLFGDGSILIPYLKQADGLFTIEGTAMNAADKGIHTVAIYTAEIDRKTIDEKFIPDSLKNKISFKNPIGTGAVSFNRKTDTEIGQYSFAEGYNTTASGLGSHAEGASTTASGTGSHAEGYGTIALGAYSHAEGYGTIASRLYCHVEGVYNILSDDSAPAHLLHIVGNGTNEDARSNAYTLDINGNAWFAGTIEGKALILPSSTTNSTKKFKITVDDSGTISATEVT